MYKYNSYYLTPTTRCMRCVTFMKQLKVFTRLILARYILIFGNYYACRTPHRVPFSCSHEVYNPIKNRNCRLHSDCKRKYFYSSFLNCLCFFHYTCTIPTYKIEKEVSGSAPHGHELPIFFKPATAQSSQVNCMSHIVFRAGDKGCYLQSTY
jgi:hypothetical protein